jgi:enoyl-CoA hydratase
MEPEATNGHPHAAQRGLPAVASSLEPVVTVERIALDPEPGTAGTIRLNRPDALNALSWQMIRELEEALNALDADDGVAAVLLTGCGRAFSAGGDLKAYIELQADPKAFPHFIDDLMRTFRGIAHMRKPVLALVNGVTAAGGLELLLSCDMAFAAESARIGDAHLNYGQMGGGGVLSLLPRMIGPARARELFFSGALLDAREACEWGLVNRVVPDDELLAAGVEFARGVARKSPEAVASGKLVMNEGFERGTGVDESMRLERERTALYCLTLPDSQEGLRAFAEKRAPRFPGR